MFGIPSVCLVVILLVALSIRPSDVVASFQLTVLHTNDVHARFDQYTLRDGRCSKSDSDQGLCFGGLARRAALVKKFRREEQNVILLDAGDQYQGTPWFYYYKGKAASHFMNELRYDAMSLGNHEFDNDIDGLVPFLQNITFPVVCANIDFDEEPSLAGLVNRSTVLSIGGRRIGVIGYLTTQCPALAKTGRLNFVDEVNSVQEEVNRLTAEGVNIIIALGHAGFNVDKDIASSVKGVDIVIGGHTNTFLYTGNPPSLEKPEGPYPWIETREDNERVLVLEAFAFGKYLGHLQVTFDDDGKAINWTGNPILLDSSVEQDRDTAEELLVWGAEVQAAYSTVIGFSSVHLDGHFLTCRLQECVLGNLITDAMVEHYQRSGKWPKLRIAVMNGGGIRSSVEKGNITYEDVLTVMPFGNEIDIVEIRGEDFIQILEHSVANYSREIRTGKFLQVSGLRVTYDVTRPNYDRVTKVEVVCEDCNDGNFDPIDENDLYQIAIPSYLVGGGDGFGQPSLQKKHFNLGDIDSDIFVEFLKRHSPVHPKIESRITLISNGTPLDRFRPYLVSSAANRLQFAPTAIALNFMRQVYNRFL